MNRCIRLALILLSLWNIGCFFVGLGRPGLLRRRFLPFRRKTTNGSQQQDAPDQFSAAKKAENPVAEAEAAAVATNPIVSPDAAEGFNETEFEQILKFGQPLREQIMTQADVSSIPEIVGSLRKEQEQLYRTYPFEENMLPVLPDCNSYFSGKFNESVMWHQNADQVYVYVPLPVDISKDDLRVTFGTNDVKVFGQGSLVINFTCPERITPDGSFWVLENDRNDQKYLHLDLEKRLRMINWRYLFGEPPAEHLFTDDERKSQLLQKIFAANKGSGKITGKETETMEEMMRNKDFMEMIQGDVSTKPAVAGVMDEAGVVKTDWANDEEAVQVQRDIESGHFTGMVGNSLDGETAEDSLRQQQTEQRVDIEAAEAESDEGLVMDFGRRNVDVGQSHGEESVQPPPSDQEIVDEIENEIASTSGQQQLLNETSVVVDEGPDTGTGDTDNQLEPG